MCGRYELKASAKNLLGHFQGLRLAAREFISRDEIFPTDSVLALVAGDHGFSAVQARWGLVGGFLDAVPSTTPLINLRSEGLQVKPFYGRLLRQKRCILPATAYFEWQGHAKGEKRRMRIFGQGDKPLWLAGIFDHHPKVGLSCAILTTEANASVRAVHDRMPVILNRTSAKFWLAEHEEFPEDEYLSLIEPAAQGELNAALFVDPEPSPQLCFEFA